MNRRGEVEGRALQVNVQGWAKTKDRERYWGEGGLPIALSWPTYLAQACAENQRSLDVARWLE